MRPERGETPEQMNDMATRHHFVLHGFMRVLCDVTDGEAPLDHFLILRRPVSPGSQQCFQWVALLRRTTISMKLA